MVDHWPLQERGGNQIGPWRRAGNQNWKFSLTRSDKKWSDDSKRNLLKKQETSFKRKKVWPIYICAVCYKCDQTPWLQEFHTVGSFWEDFCGKWAMPFNLKLKSSPKSGFSEQFCALRKNIRNRPPMVQRCTIPCHWRPFFLVWLIRLRLQSVKQGAAVDGGKSPQFSIKSTKDHRSIAFLSITFTSRQESQRIIAQLRPTYYCWQPRIICLLLFSMASSTSSEWIGRGARLHCWLSSLNRDSSPLYVLLIEASLSPLIDW